MSCGVDNSCAYHPDKLNGKNCTDENSCHERCESDFKCYDFDKSKIKTCMTHASSIKAKDMEERKKASLQDSNHLLKTQDLSQIRTNIKILYGLLITIVTFFIILLWILQNQIHTLRNECLKVVPTRRLDIQNYGIIFDKSNFQNKLYLRMKRNRRMKRESGNYNYSHKEAASIHDYCRSFYNLCDSRSARGPPGPPGVPVDRGPPGPPGPQGPKGDQGQPGERGPPGRFGFDGIAGTPGDKGEPGEKGDRGLIGFDGQKGDVGYPGPKGDKGNIGPIGARGSIGPQGHPGPEGVKGHVGDEGRRGKTGKEGPKGDKGNKGVDGIPGVPGFKGETGVTGERGPPGYGINCICEKGDKGEKGQRGLVGFTGYKGDDGIPGQKGDRGFGLKGEQGPIGPPGIPGLKGQKGDCDVWSKEKKEFRVVNIDPKDGSNNQLNDIPQQDYQAHEDGIKQSTGHGSRGSRSSGTNSVNHASRTICSLIQYMIMFLLHLFSHQRNFSFHN